MKEKRAIEIMVDENLIYKHDDKNILMEVYYTNEKRYDEYTVHLKTNDDNVIRYITIQ